MGTESTPPKTDHDRVKIGVAGWSYPDWRGIVYPAERPGGFSELRSIAKLFDCVEVNCTFYRYVPAATTAAWARTVGDIPGFTFTVKAHRELTHAEDASVECLRAGCRQLAESLGPLEEAGRLGGVLLQFPWYFEDSEPHRERLALVAGELAPATLFVEVRHRSFLGTSAADALPFFEKRGLNFTNIDLPSSRTSPSLGSINTGRFGYFRLHGRNRRAWFDAAAGRDEKYDYLYSRPELAGILPAIERVAARTQVTYVIANNHFRGQAAANALELASMLSRAPVDVPDGLVREFPSLEALRRPAAAPPPARGGVTSP